MTATPTVSLQPVRLPLAGFDDLLADSVAEGQNMLRRLADGWSSGANRFSKPAETLVAAHARAALIGLCGRNVDPYLGDPRIGRVRHLYVRREARRRGVGRILVLAVVDDAGAYFDELTVRAVSVEAAAFYEALGFERRDRNPLLTHALRLRAPPRSGVAGSAPSTSGSGPASPRERVRPAVGPSDSAPPDRR